MTGFEDAGGAEGAGGGEAVGRPAEEDDVVEMLVVSAAEADDASEGAIDVATSPSEDSVEDAMNVSVVAMLSVCAKASALPVGDTDPPYAQPSPKGMDGP